MYRSVLLTFLLPLSVCAAPWTTQQLHQWGREILPEVEQHLGRRISYAPKVIASTPTKARQMLLYQHKEKTGEDAPAEVDDVLKIAIGFFNRLDGNIYVFEERCRENFDAQTRESDFLQEWFAKLMIAHELAHAFHYDFLKSVGDQTHLDPLVSPMRYFAHKAVTEGQAYWVSKKIAQVHAVPLPDVLEKPTEGQAVCLESAASVDSPEDLHSIRLGPAFMEALHSVSPKLAWGAIQDPPQDYHFYAHPDAFIDAIRPRLRLIEMLDALRPALRNPRMFAYWAPFTKSELKMQNIDGVPPIDGRVLRLVEGMVGRPRLKASLFEFESFGDANHASGALNSALMLKTGAAGLILKQIPELRCRYLLATSSSGLEGIARSSVSQQDNRVMTIEDQATRIEDASEYQHVLETLWSYFAE